MTTATLKDQIKEDISRLKNLQIDILPSGVFYPKLARLMAMFYLIVVGIPFFLMVFIKGSELSSSFYVNDLIILSVLFIVVSIFSIFKFAEFVTFNETIKPHLVLGNAIDRLFKFYFICFSVVYLFWAFLYTTSFYTWDFSHVGERGFTVVPGFIFGVIVSSILFQLELTRVGAAAIFELISSSINKDPLKTD